MVNYSMGELLYKNFIYSTFICSFIDRESPNLEEAANFGLKEFQGTPHLLYHPYRAFSSNYKFSMHMSLQFQENLPKARKIPYHQVMEQLPCAGIPNFEQVIIHSCNNIVVILVPGYHGYFRLHEFVFFCTSVTI